MRYLSILTTDDDDQDLLSMGYACPTCEIRIANEEDMIKKPFSNNNGDVCVNATYSRAYNLVHRQKNVCCYRCNTRLVDYDAQDPFMLTVPLYKAGNTRTLLKREYRLLSLVYTTGATLMGLPLFDRSGEKLREYTDNELITMMQEPDYPKDAGDNEDKDVFLKMRSVVDSLGTGKQVSVRRILAFNAQSAPYRNLKTPELEKKVWRNL